ncbi:MAG: hypothetical protein ND895_04090 [Pyrinomonadaceae bacterium]|nr:hypothetical protein [Pyrinomonadaceae bacterium]
MQRRGQEIITTNADGLQSQPDWQSPTTSRWRPICARFLETVIGVVLLLAGLLKAYEPVSFAQQISEYEILTAPALVKALAWTLIAVECALGAALITGLRRRWTIPAAAVLLLTFIGAVGWAWWSGAIEHCGCFGSWAQRTPAQALAEDVSMLTAIVGAWFLYRSEPLNYRRVRLGAVAVALLAGISMTVVASNSARQSNNPLVRLQAQTKQPSPFDNLSVAGLPLKLAEGNRLVALINTGCQHCQASVPALNQVVSQKDKLPPLVALCPDSAQEVELFRQEFGAQFPVGRVSYDDFTRLFERGKPPRIFLLRDGAVVKIWDGEVPNETEITKLVAGS